MKKNIFCTKCIRFPAHFLAWRHEIKLIFFLIFSVFWYNFGTFEWLSSRTGSALLYNGPFIALTAKLLSEKPLELPLILQRGSTGRQAGALTTGYTTTPRSCATPHTELWHTPYWAAPHPILSFGTPHIELRHTPYWAAPHPILSYATPHTELSHTPYWAMPHPYRAMPHPILSYTTPYTQLCHTLCSVCMYVYWWAGATTLSLLGS